MKRKAINLNTCTKQNVITKQLDPIYIKQNVIKHISSWSCHLIQYTPNKM